MKNKILLFLALICCSYATFAQNKLFDKFSDMDGVTSVFISKTMLQMMPNMKTNGLDIGNVAGKLESIEILTSEKKSIAQMMRAETAYIAKDKSYEELMKIKDDGSKVSFFIRKSGGDKIKELVMLVDETSEFVIIRILGDMTLKDIQNITKQ